MKDQRILFYDDRYLDLLYDPRAKSGGATQQVVGWVKGMRELGVDVKVIGAHKDPDFFQKHDDIIISYDPRRGVPKLRYLYIRIPSLLSALRKSDATHVYYGVPSPFAGVLAILVRALGQRMILRISNDCFVDSRSRERFGWLRHTMFALGFRFADSILCQNEYQYKNLRERYPGKVFKIANPYSSPVAATARSFRERTYVAWVGIFQQQKNMPRLVQIAKQMPELRFLIAGGNDKDLLPSDEEALSEFKRMENVELKGFLSKEGVLRLLANAYFLLNTSHYEGFSNTFLEAFSTGTPVVTFTHNDPDEIISRNGLGRVVPPDSRIDEPIRSLMGDPRGYETMSRNCLRFLRENHNLRRQARSFLNLVGPASEKNTQRHKGNSMAIKRTDQA